MVIRGAALGLRSLCLGGGAVAWSPGCDTTLRTVGAASPTPPPCRAANPG
jgi:hypothetical protein